MNQIKKGFMYIFVEECDNDTIYKIFNDYEGEHFLFNPLNSRPLA